MSVILNFLKNFKVSSSRYFFNKEKESNINSKSSLDLPSKNLDVISCPQPGHLTVINGVTFISIRELIRETLEAWDKDNMKSDSMTWEQLEQGMQDIIRNFNIKNNPYQNRQVKSRGKGLTLKNLYVLGGS